MLFFLITCFSLVFLHKSLAFNPIRPFICEMRLLSIWFWKDFLLFPITKSIINDLFGVTFSFLTSRMSIKKKNVSSKVENIEINSEMSVMDLPDLVLECILEKLPPKELCRMSSVCTSLRDRCTSDHLWDKHMKKKWGRIVGSAAYREWQWYFLSRKGSVFINYGNQKGIVGYITHLWPFALIRSSFSNIRKMNSFSPVDSIMSWYLALESGNFWFPAQVYNRENAHAGFMLSCYDAELSYDRQTDTFRARYPPHGRRPSARLTGVTWENGVTWDRLRSPPVDTSAHDLHVSDCLNELRPGDHIEIQWRRTKEFPYGWWYGVVGHLETCDGNANYCQCHDSADTLVLEFNHYTLGSPWRRRTVNRKDHQEAGNEADGFYGGIRKLCTDEEISIWKKLWPAEALE